MRTSEDDSSLSKKDEKKNSCNKGLSKMKKTLKLFNPLLNIGRYSVRMTKISILKLEGIIKKISLERRVYESLDDSSLF